MEQPDLSVADASLPSVVPAMILDASQPKSLLYQEDQPRPKENASTYLQYALFCWAVFLSFTNPLALLKLFTMHRASAFIDIVPQGASEPSKSAYQRSSTAKAASRPKPVRRLSKKKLVQVTISEVEAANTASKPWVAIRGKVYDLTGFVDKHPGGKDFLLAAVGRDATAMYESIHTEKNNRVLNKYLIGTLKGATNMPEYRDESAFYEEVKKRVDVHFKATGQDSRAAPRMIITYVVVSAIFIAMYMPMFWRPTAWSTSWIPYVAAAITGWSCAMMGFYTLHDSCHASFSKSPFVWNILRRIYECFTGLNTLLWIYQHGIGHHPFTNVIGADPDIVSDDPGTLRVHTEQPYWSHYRWQKYYWLPLYSQLVLSRKLTEYKNVFYDRAYKHIKINPVQLSEYFWAFTTLSIYATHHYVVPYFLFQVPLLRLIALHTVTDLTWSVYLTLIFQASHVNNDVAWPDPSNADQSDWKQSDWAALQIESSLDFAHGDFWTTFLCGSLNYQAVHHLFPHVSQLYYPQLAPIVKEVCEEYGVRYNLKDSIWSMISAHASRIEMFGDEELVLR